MERSVWEKRAAFLLTLALGSALIYLALRYVLPLLLPFLAAWLLSLAVRPLSLRLAKYTRIPQKALAVGLLMLLLGGTVFLLGLSVRRLLGELQELLERMLAEGGELSELAMAKTDYFELLTSKISFLGRLGKDERFASFRTGFNEMAEKLVGELLGALTAGIPNFVGKVVSAFPTVLFCSVITVIAGFYFCLDGGGIGHAALIYLPQAVRARIPLWRERIRRLSWRYLRAYLLLTLLTFSALFFGFCILGVDYAFLLAALVALVDLLPVLGVGTVLIPWACVLFLQHHFSFGLGLLILYLAVTLLRQIVEPRLVGKSLGLHPLVALLATYAGWRLLGLWGMLIGPFLALAAKSLLAQTQK